MSLVVFIPSAAFAVDPEVGPTPSSTTVSTPVTITSSISSDDCIEEGEELVNAGRGSGAYCVKAGDGENTAFLQTDAGKTIQSIARLLAYVLAIWGVVKAATKAFGRQGGEQGGIGVFAKALPLPIIGAAFLWNLQWAFNLLSWALKIIQDAVTLIGNAFPG